MKERELEKRKGPYLEVGDNDVSPGDLNFEKALSGAGKYFGGRDVLDRDQQ